MSITSPREAAVAALLKLVTGAYAWKSPPSRKLVLWSGIAPVARPVCFLHEGGTETHEWSQNAIVKRTIPMRLFVYTDSTNPTTIGATALNLIADALDAALKPAGADIPLGRNTLGGTAYSARIEGAVLKDPGDVDGDGIMTVPIRITLP